MDTAEKTEETTSDAAQNTGDPKPLILPSLEIKNFRAFKHLTIEKLGRVNLITGKNNVGKTSLLEALWLYSEAAHPAALWQILSERAELHRHSNPFAEDNDLNAGLDGETLFYGRQSSEKRAYFTIGEQTDNSGRQTNAVTLRLYLVGEGSQQIVNAVVSAFGSELTYDFDAVITGNAVTANKALIRFDSVTARDVETRLRFLFRGIALPHLFLTTRRMNAEKLASLWDSIVLRSREQNAIQALKIIDNEVEKVTFVAGEAKTRVPVIKRHSEQRPSPLDSFGEGFVRLLSISASLTVAEGGILLIDEIENGLHYSVLPDVWRLIFQTARKLNVQVFATTHSWDCIEAFQQAASEDDDPTSGVLVRLRNKDGDVVSTVFDEEDLAVITREGIEVR